MTGYVIDEGNVLVQGVSCQTRTRVDLEAGCRVTLTTEHRLGENDSWRWDEDAPVFRGQIGEALPSGVPYAWYVQKAGLAR